MKNILIIGCGLLGSSLLRRIQKKKMANKIYIYEKSKSNITKIKKLKLPGIIIKKLEYGAEASMRGSCERTSPIVTTTLRFLPKAALKASTDAICIPQGLIELRHPCLDNNDTQVIPGWLWIRDMH